MTTHNGLLPMGIDNVQDSLWWAIHECDEFPKTLTGKRIDFTMHLQWRERRQREQLSDLLKEMNTPKFWNTYLTVPTVSIEVDGKDREVGKDAYDW